jgi:hypothetical protein
VKDSVVSGNIKNGISVNTASANVGLLVENTTVSSNNYGLVVAGTNGLILVRRSTITANNNGLLAGGGGSLASYSPVCRGCIDRRRNLPDRRYGPAVSGRHFNRNSPVRKRAWSAGALGTRLCFGTYCAGRFDTRDHRA